MRLRLLTLRDDDLCARCAAPIPARSRAWQDDRSAAVCVLCEPLRFDDPFPPPDIERTSADAPTAREFGHGPHERSRTNGSSAGAGVLGRVMRLLADEPSATTHLNGAVRERRLGRLLDTELVDAVTLHDVTVPPTHCHLDHLVVASSGIWLIDARRSAGEVECRPAGAFGSGDLRLFVNGRNQTQLVHEMGWQVAAVRAQLGRIGFGQVPVHAVMCFASSRWAQTTSPFEVHGVMVTWPSALVDAIGAPGPIDTRLIELVAHDLSRVVEVPAPSIRH
jgi:hypothetical protein